MAKVSAVYNVQLRYEGNLSSKGLNELVKSKLESLPGFYDLDIQYFSVNDEKCDPGDEDENKNTGGKCSYGLECSCENCFYPGCIH